MADVSNLGDMIRFPFLLIGGILNFLLKYFLEIAIGLGAIWVIYYLFKSGFIRKITEMVEDYREEKKQKDINMEKYEKEKEEE